MKIEIKVPNGTSGPWTIDECTVSPDDSKMDRLRALMNGSGRYAPAGTYKRLICGRDTVMSNTPDEIRDHYPFFREAKGNVLINGLGLGMCIEMIRDRVDHITVIELSEDVISLVGPTYADDPMVTIIHANSLEYKPENGVRFDAVWHDIWTNISSDNHEDMKKLHRRYGRITDWQGSWCRWLVEKQVREDKRYERERISFSRMFAGSNDLKTLKSQLG